MNDQHRFLEFDVILKRLSDLAVSDGVKAKCLALAPTLDEREAKRRLAETGEARRVLEATGSPPLAAMAELEKLIALIEAGDMLLPEQLERFALFASSCRRMKQYLRRAESTGCDIAFYGGSIRELSGLQSEIERCIRGAQVDDKATGALWDIRRGMQNVADQIKAKLNALLAKNAFGGIPFDHIHPPVIAFGRVFNAQEHHTQLFGKKVHQRPYTHLALHHLAFGIDGAWQRETQLRQRGSGHFAVFGFRRQRHR
ncbi:MAG TPA: hypothetical protein PK438_07950, partial [Clostridia bacterium]|nr:hypothetical protein [Clostridia bacterium]